jgi:hypothetical protein
MIEDFTLEEHNYLIDMGFVQKKFEIDEDSEDDENIFWYSLLINNVGFFHEVDIHYNPSSGSLVFYITLFKDGEPLEFTYLTEMYDLIMVESLLVSAGIIPYNENRRITN